MSERSMGRPLAVVAQLGAVWVLGTALPMSGVILVLAAYVGGTVLVVVSALLTTAVVLACLFAVVTSTREVSLLGATARRRALWAVLVLVLGSVGWLLEYRLVDITALGGSPGPLLTYLLWGFPFALVAGVFLRGWPYRFGAPAVALVLVGAGLVASRPEPPGEFDAWLAANNLTRETAYAVAIPGYLPDSGRDYGNGLGGGSFHPRDPGAVPPDRYLTITAHDQLVPGEGMCGQPTALDSRLAWGSCTAEAGGLVYRYNEVAHGYQVPVGHRQVTVVGTPAVEHDLLRAAASSLRPATAAELGAQPNGAGEYYAATVPGYVGQVTGIPAGMLYAPADGTGNGARTVAITLYAAHADGGAICFQTTECTPDGSGLTYVRNQDTHGYVARHGAVNVRVLGGPRVDRTLLRQAAVAARPATDAELRRALPAPTPRGALDRFREWLREF
ncbi:hypothetical protein AB0J86_20865 [Micromonospora sp. NPDC049559]|uniref:hypothetical protein n=1 Tax=Micromonospora sp. NPDC049559 TaxID=3155923 RepID=UPI00342F159C